MWLVFLIIANGLGATVYLLAGNLVLAQMPNLSPWEIYLLCAAAVANVVFAILIWNWRRLGFWGLMATALLGIIINVVAHNLWGAALGLIFPAILVLLVRPHWAQLR